MTHTDCANQRHRVCDHIATIKENVKNMAEMTTSHFEKSSRNGEF